MHYWHQELKKERKEPPKDEMKGSYLGPNFSSNEIQNSLSNLGATFEKLSEEEIFQGVFD
mgnify:CR=1 FL=1